MIIGFDGSRAFHSERTGTENYSYQLLKSLAKIDHKNEYIVYIRDKRYEIRDKWPKNFKFKVIKWPRLWTQVGLAKQTFQDNLDVLFIPAHTSPLVHKPGLKTVVTVHDLGAEYLPTMHQLKQRLYLKWITHYQLKSATKLIAVSKATKDDLIKRVGIDPKKIEIIYEGYDEKLFRPVKGDSLISSLSKFDLEAGKYFLFVGTVQPRKNLERLIKAYLMYVSRGPASSVIPANAGIQLKTRPHDNLLDPRLRGDDKIILVIAGSKGWLSDEIYKLPKKLGIENNVKFLGRVKDEELPVLYSGAIALTFPSLFEGFGLPILEAQACGCPVITSNISSMPEVAGKAAIYINPYDVNDIVEGMSRITKNYELRTKLTKLGFENIKRFSWEKCARETLEVLTSS